MSRRRERREKKGDRRGKERERESKGKHCGLWTGPNANTALPSVDEGLLALSRNQVAPRRNTREKGAEGREREEKKEGPSERMDNGQMSVHRALSTRMQPTGAQTDSYVYVFYYSCDRGK